MRSLGRLVRGLSALFWGLPIGLVVCVYVATNELLRPSFMLAPTLATGLLLYGVFLLGNFQKQERIWREALDRTKLLATVNVGLSPFIYWYTRLPQVPLYGAAVFLLVISGILFLYNLNHMLQRLSAMLPDETLRTETRVFGNLNLSLLSSILILLALYFVVRQFNGLPLVVENILRAVEFFQNILAVFLILLPVAMTMTLIWKIKEVVFSSVFSHPG